MPKVSKKRSRISDGLKRRKEVKKPKNPTDTPIQATLSYKARTKAFQLSVKSTRSSKSGYKLYQCDSVPSGERHWGRGDIARVDVGSKDEGYVLILDIYQEWSDADCGTVGDTFFVIAWLYDKSDVGGGIDCDQQYVLSSHVQTMYDGFNGPSLEQGERESKVDTNQIWDFQMRAPVKLRKIEKKCIVAEAIAHWDKMIVESVQQELEDNEEENATGLADEQNSEHAHSNGEQRNNDSDAEVQLAEETTKEVTVANTDSIVSSVQPTHQEDASDDRSPAETSNPAALQTINEKDASSRQNVGIFTPEPLMKYFKGVMG